MKQLRIISFFIIPLLLIGCYSLPVSVSIPSAGEQELTPVPKIITTKGESRIGKPSGVSSRIRERPTLVTPTPDPFPDLYGCNMQIEFISGSLENQSSEFSVLDRSYFLDKGDKFAVGKGTAVYYEDQPYMILHSSYVNGNILKPMEAEFIRKYLEHWGNKGDEYIQNQIDNLVGAQVNWYCNDDLVLETTINSIVRLSHDASERLWLEPLQIVDILENKQGLASEWIGEILPTDQASLFLGFCGWGSSSVGSGRYTYYRYLINFVVETP
ncbi:MAG: hypothetical protein SCH68_05690 [Brevefilum sp.]|nr:hypothetical protein [Brevefilum sp.]